MRRSAGRTVTTALTLSLATGLGGAASEASADGLVRSGDLARAAADTGRRYTKADVRFTQGMIAHHAQALAMAALVPSHAKGASVRLLAQRIEVAQKDEIELMQHWLADRHESVPNPSHEQHDAAAGDTLMPGMLTPKQMAQLANATGFQFDWLFLELMIQHHRGALTMVERLFAVPGAGQGSDVYRLASNVDADQRAEIKRMTEMLGAPAGSGRP